MNTSLSAAGIQTRDNYFSFFSERIHAEHYFRSWAAVSLTLKQHKKRDDATIQRLSVCEVSKCIKQLLKTVNRSVYGAAYRRHGKRLMNVSVIEGGGGKHLHAHLLLEIPSYMAKTPMQFFAVIRREWSRLRWADREKDFQPICTPSSVSGWIGYILKDCAFDDGIIDLNNTIL